MLFLNHIDLAKSPAVLLRRWSVNSSSRVLIAWESVDLPCPIKFSWTSLNFTGMTLNITEMHLFRLHSSYSCNILKYFSNKCFFLFFSSICWTVSKGDKNEDKKNKRIMQNKKPHLSGQKIQPSLSWYYHIYKLVHILKYQQVIFLGTIWSLIS